MDFSYIQNGHSDYEGFLMGDPEFEVLTISRLANSMDQRTEACAGEHSVGDFVYDQNDDSWSGQVLVLRSDKLADLNQRGVPFALSVFEDDYQSCDLWIDATQWSNIKQGLGLAGGVLYFGLAWSDCPSGDPNCQGVQVYVAVFGALLLDWARSLNEDDYVGTLLPACQTGHSFSDANHAIIGENNELRGRAQIINTADTTQAQRGYCPPPPMSVSLDGPGTGQAFESVTMTATASHYSGPLTYNWTTNGSPACGNQSTCTGQLGDEGSYTSFAVTVTDSIPQTAGNSTNVFAEFSGCPGCNRPGSSARPGDTPMSHREGRDGRGSSLLTPKRSRR